MTVLIEGRRVIILFVDGILCSFCSVGYSLYPHPCGCFTDPQRQCKCSPNTIERYMGRVSGPMIDRIDIHVEVPPVPWWQLIAGCCRSRNS